MTETNTQLLSIEDNRKKNALTIYEIADYQGETEAPADGYLKIGKWIPNINNESTDTVKEEGYYDGDGTAEDVVDGTKEKYSVEGLYDEKDPAQALIVSKKRKRGDGRKVWFRVTHTNGEIENGLATLSNIQNTGGQATEFAPFKCSIARDHIPTVTPAV